MAGPDRTPAGAARDAALFARYRQFRDSASREALVTRFLPLARHLARRYRTHAEHEDLEQVASLALLKAIDRFDPDRGLAFSTFAVPTISGELKRYFRDHGWVVRVPREVQELKLRLDSVAEAMNAELGRSPTPSELADRADTTVESVLEALAATTAHHPDSLDRPRRDDDGEVHDAIGGRLDPAFARAEDATVVDSLLTALPDRDQLVLRLRFERDLTQAEIGRRLGISQMHVSRVIRQSIAVLQAEALGR